MERQDMSLSGFFRNFGDRTIGETETLARKVLPAFFILVFVTTAAGAVLGYLAFNNWTMGDWLINYQGGFVRRGFLGECVFRLSLLSGINAGLVVVAFQLFFYLLFFLFSFLLLRGRKVLFPYLLLVFSPFIFLFQVYDPQGGYRKEILFFALFSLLAWAAVNLKSRAFTRVFYGILLIFPLAVLSHEMLVIFLPYLFAAYFQRESLTWRNGLASLFLGCLSVVALVFCVQNRGTPGQVRLIQDSLVSVSYPVQGGAIEALSRTAGTEMKRVWNLLAEGRYFMYLFLLLYALIAFVPVFRCRGGGIQAGKLPVAFVLLSLAGTVPLLALAVDWGRFIDIHLVSIFLLLFMWEPRIEGEPRRPETKLMDAFGKCGLKKPAVVKMFLFWYLFLWCIPHYGSPAFYPRQVNFIELAKPFFELAGVLFRSFS